MISWINGSFVAGETSLALLLRERCPRSLMFDPKKVGFMLRGWFLQ